MTFELKVEFTKEELEQLAIAEAWKRLQPPCEGDFEVVYQGRYADSVKLRFVPKPEVQEDIDKGQDELTALANETT
jgi:hypothetical protein